MSSQQVQDAKAKLQAAMDALIAAEEADKGPPEDPALTAAKQALADQFSHVAHRDVLVQAIHDMIVAVIATLPPPVDEPVHTSDEPA